MYKIALCGKANSGKNTAANCIVNSLIDIDGKLPKFIYAFADPIKEMLKLMFPQIPKKHLYKSSQFRNEIILGAIDKLGNPLTIRQALLDIGTGLGRSYKDTVWLDAFDSRCNKIKGNKGILIVPDLRFYNEFEFLKNKGFYIIKINRVTNSVINHSSETEQDKIPINQFNYVIDNNKSLEELKLTIKNHIVPDIKSLCIK